MKLVFSFLLLIIFSPQVVFAAGCSLDGYTVLTINGMYTNQTKARENSFALQRKLEGGYKNQKLTVDFLHNPSHLAGLGDFTDVITQKLHEFDATVPDYDLVEMWNTASQKVKTQKVLLVGHSQGNFYANSFHGLLADKQGGIPGKSFGVYGVANPASFVAGDGFYITSDTDSIINELRGRFLTILPVNAKIKLPDGNTSNGHSFSDIYLQYQGDRIISEIKYSLGRLKENDIQSANNPCILPPELDLSHKITGMILAFADPTAIAVKTATVNTATTAYRLASAFGNSVLNAVTYTASRMGNSGNPNSAAVVLATEKNTKTEENPTKDIAASKRKEKVAEVPTGKASEIPEQASPVTSVTSETQAVPEIIPPTVPFTSASSGWFGGTGSGGAAADTSPPVISISGSNPASITINTAYTDAGATALDDVDGTAIVVTAGSVNTAVLGAYTITYTATDAAGNTATATRTVNVVDLTPPPPPSDTTPPAITLNGSSSIYITKSLTELYTDAGATATDAVDGAVSVVTTGAVDRTTIGTYTLTYTTTDAASNQAQTTRTVKVATYVYIPKFTFGTGNGDGNNWQAWRFNGSYVYNWSDTYVNHYLREQFKFKNFAGGSDRLQRGIWNHDPKLGFETSDLTKSVLENSPQSNLDTHYYSVDIQWDSTGYTYTITDTTTSTVYDSAHTNVSNINQNMWVGWNSSSTDSDFQFFPSNAEWQGVLSVSSEGYTGGRLIMLTPYPVYVP